jgi:hypothetical protein
VSNAIGTSYAAASGTAAAPTATRERGGAGQSERYDCQDQGKEVHSGISSWQLRTAPCTSLPPPFVEASAGIAPWAGFSLAQRVRVGWTP